MWRRYFLYFLVCTLTFEFGAVAKLSLDKLILSDEERIELLKDVKQFDTPRPIVNETGPLLIEYSHTEPLPDDFEAVFVVTNFSNENIFFGRSENDTTNLCGLHEGRLPKTFRVGSVGCLIDRTVLKP